MAAFHPRARLDSYVEGALAPASHERVTAHLVDCADCRQEVDQRRRILRAASSLGHARPHHVRSLPYPGRPSGPGEAPVLERREGVAGWKVVLGLGSVGLLATGALAGAWVAGDPAATGTGTVQERLLPVAGPESSAAGESGRSPAVASSASSAAASAGAVSPEAVAEGPADPADAAVLSPAGAALPSTGPTPTSSPGSGDTTAGPTASPGDARGTDGTALAAAVELTPGMVSELRQSGWNVPTLNGLGLRSEGTDWQHGEGAAEVVMTLAGDAHSLELHECRPLREGSEAPACPVEWAAGPASTPASTPGAAEGAASPPGADGAADPIAGVVAEPLARAGAEVVELPVGVEMTVRERADGSWSALMTTTQASYAVDSDLPVESAPRVMSMVVISERSRVQGGSAPDSAADRLARGFERILPWAGGIVAGPR